MGSRLNGAGYAQVYATAQKWADSALRTDGSLFTPGQAIWTTQGLRELRAQFLEKPDESGSSFMSKLQAQLAGSSAAAHQLMGEALYLHFLIADKMTSSAKTNLINQVLGRSPSLGEMPQETVDGFGQGLIGASVGFYTLRPYLVGFIIEFVEHWKGIPQDEQRRLLDDPWRFRDLLWNVPLTSALFASHGNAPNLQRLALMHLLFPDTFEPIVSIGDKGQIAATFAQLVKEPTEDVDRQLQQIRKHFEGIHGERNHLLYIEPIKNHWAGPTKPPPWDDFVKSARAYVEKGKLDEEEITYKVATGRRLAEAREAVLAGSADWAERVKRGIGGNLVFPVNQQKFRDWIDGHSEDALQALRALWTPEDTPLPERVSSFMALLPSSAISGVGTRMNVASVLLMGLDVEQFPPFETTVFEKAYQLTEYNQPPASEDEAGRYAHALGFLNRFIKEANSRNLPIRHRLDAQSVVWAIVKGRVPNPPPPSPPPPLEELAESLCFPVAFLEDIKYLIEEKKQVIFQGPPGTGKTYVARALAKFLAGGAQDHVTLVQFHPSYAYEDFVQGFRPKADGEGFDLRDGPLKQIADKARNNEEETYVLVIDEINRGNLGKVFGELYFLLEYRDSEIQLQYSDKRFALPENLLVIGTMNTADRSIALVDLALRRRFYFKDFHPDEEPVKSVLRRWLRKNNQSMEWVADLVAAANEKMADDRHAAIGPSYFMMRNLNAAAVRRIWEHSVLPYIEERFFGDQDRLADFRLSKLLQDRFPSGPENQDDSQDHDAAEGNEQPNNEAGPDGVST